MTPNDNDRIIPKAVSRVDGDRIIPKAHFRVDRNAQNPITHCQETLLVPKPERQKRPLRNREYDTY